jgi:1-acyl-sn-glycerol-3-phosphate acyltransferase
MAYRLGRAAFRLIARPMLRFRVEGVERVPRSGPAVVVAPHRSWLDPPCLIGACPRPLRFLIMERVYRRPATTWLYRAMLAIPVRVGGGAVTIRALRRALRALGEGEVIGVFPEGRVLPEGDLGDFHPGAAMLAARGRARVVPMVIRGSAAAWPHGRSWPGPGRVTVHIGQALEPPDGADRETLGRYLDRIRDGLRELGAGGVAP